MSTLYVGLEQGLVQAPLNGGASFHWSFRGAPVQSIAVDPLVPNRVYAATLGEGLWRTDDAGETWERAGKGIASPCTWVVAVSRCDRASDAGAVYVGTELSALYRSTDAGASFEELPALAEHPSRREWSFPPAPDTHHLHSIALDVTDPEIVLCGIELGGVLRSTDRGKSFEQTDADPDPHTLRTHPFAPARMYEGGGTSFVESRDHGATWERLLDGIPDEIRYFFSFEVDPGDPDTMVISAAKDPFSGHAVPLPGFDPWSTLYRRTAGAAWQEVTDGLPAREGTAMGTLVTSPALPGVFSYVTVPGALFRSGDGGASWRELACEWPAEATARKVAAAAIGGW